MRSTVNPELYVVVLKLKHAKLHALWYLSVGYRPLGKISDD